MSDKKHIVAVLGASNKPERYSHKAVVLLIKHSYSVIPVHPTLETIENIPVTHSLKDITGTVDTLTIYVGPKHIQKQITAIVDLKPGRVILNPGTESETLKQTLGENNIPYLEACTLVLLKSGQF